MNSNLEKRTFDIHPDVIHSFIFKQYHSVSSALQELIQNAHDAGASNVFIEIGDTHFTCIDDGRGFTQKKEITEWFERFGAPREEVREDAFGRFRLGRGQIMGKAITTWRSGEFEMRVDPKKDGLDYSLETGMGNASGCMISGEWYEPLNQMAVDKGIWTERPETFENVVERLTRDVKFIFSMNVFVNGEKITRSSSETNWTLETDDFYFLRKPEDEMYGSRNKVRFYNLGVFIEEMAGLRDTGIVITKKHLSVNITRSKIQEDCSLFNDIKTYLRARKIVFNRSKRYPTYKARDIFHQLCEGDLDLNEIRHLKLISDYHNRTTISLDTLSKRRFTIARKGDSQADLIDQAGRFFVMDEDCLPAEPSYALTRDHHTYLFKQILKIDKEFGERLASKYTRFKAIAETIDDTKVLLPDEDLSPDEACILKALYKVFDYKFFIGLSAEAIGWTDGHSYIAIERNWLKKQDSGLPMINNLMLLVFHELSHKPNESEHDGEFYKRYHDLTHNKFSGSLKDFLTAYDNELAKNRVRVSNNIHKMIHTVRRAVKSKKVSD